MSVSCVSSVLAIFSKSRVSLFWHTDIMLMLTMTQSVREKNNNNVNTTSLSGFIAGDTPLRMHSFSLGRYAPSGKTMHPSGVSPAIKPSRSSINDTIDNVRRNFKSALTDRSKQLVLLGSA